MKHTVVCPAPRPLVSQISVQEVGGEQLQAAAWNYPDPKPAAKQISGYVAFWKGVRVVASDEA